MIADGALQRWIARFDSIEHRALRDRAGDIERQFAVDLGKRLQVMGKDDADHGELTVSAGNPRASFWPTQNELANHGGET
jgi:hypothetical protein